MELHLVGCTNVGRCWLTSFKMSFQTDFKRKPEIFVDDASVRLTLIIAYEIIFAISIYLLLVLDIIVVFLAYMTLVNSL